MMLLRGAHDGPARGEGIAAQVGVLSLEASVARGMQVVKESYHALPGLAIPDVLRVVDDVVVVGSTAAAHAPIRTFKLGPPLVPLRTLLLSSEGGVRLRGLSIQGLMVCGMLMRGPPPGSTTTPPAIFNTVSSSTPAILELSVFQLEASAAPLKSLLSGGGTGSSGSGSERNASRDNTEVNRQASVDVPSPSSMSSYGVARSDSRPQVEETLHTDHRLSMVAELSSASQLSQEELLQLLSQRQPSDVSSLDVSQSESVFRQHSLSEGELARMRALGITFGAGLSPQTEQTEPQAAAGSTGETLSNTAQEDGGLLAALLSLQNTVETRLDRVDRTLQAHDERLSHLEAMCFRLSHQDSGQSRNNSHSELSHSGHSLGNRTTSR